MNNLTELMTVRDELKTATEEARKRWLQLQEHHNQVEKEIMSTCKHEWELDHKQELAPYDRRDRICNICNSRLISPGY